jgi:RNA-directed DNA polymerase
VATGEVMAKRIRNLYDDIASFEQLRASAKKAKKGICLNRSLLCFWNDLDVQLLQLQRQLLSHTYQPLPYHSFMLSDPKPRHIQAADFADRVVHHSLCQSLAPHFERSYLAHSFACQKGKGNHRAIRQTQKFTRKFIHGYYLKFDIKHCFETLDHRVLLQKIKKRIACEPTLELCELIVSHGGHEGKGLPIGNLTSQHFANYYLDSLDHYCVETLKTKGFVRYMDDILLFSHTKNHLLEMLGEVTCYISNQLRQEIKHSATRLAPVSHGVPFLGFRIYPNCIRFDSGRKHRFIKTWKEVSKETESKKRILRFNSLVAWSEQANTCHLRQKLLKM